MDHKQVLFIDDKARYLEECRSFSLNIRRITWNWNGNHFLQVIVLWVTLRAHLRPLKSGYVRIVLCEVRGKRESSLAGWDLGEFVHFPANWAMAKLNESPSGSSEVRSRSDRGAIVPASQVRAEQGSSTVLISSSSPETRAMTQRPRALSPVQSPVQSPETLSNFLQGVGAPTNEPISFGGCARCIATSNTSDFCAEYSSN